MLTALVFSINYNSLQVFRTPQNKFVMFNRNIETFVVCKN